jgi:hypothetical protein
MSIPGGFISMANEPSGAPPSAVPSTFSRACGLTQRNAVTVPSILTTRMIGIRMALGRAARVDPVSTLHYE